MWVTDGRQSGNIFLKTRDDNFNSIHDYFLNQSFEMSCWTLFCHFAPISHPHYPLKISTKLRKNPKTSAPVLRVTARQGVCIDFTWQHPANQLPQRTVILIQVNDRQSHQLRLSESVIAGPRKSVLVRIFSTFISDLYMYVKDLVQFQTYIVD